MDGDKLSNIILCVALGLATIVVIAFLLSRP